MILIDLPMPEACDVCPFNYDFCWCNAFGNHDEWQKYSDDWNDHVCDRKTRPEYCPLKEQEAVEPRVSTAEQRCGNCNKVIEMDGWQSCPWCGKRIDWKGWWKKNGTRNQDS